MPISPVFRTFIIKSYTAIYLFQFFFILHIVFPFNVIFILAILYYTQQNEKRYTFFRLARRKAYRGTVF